MLNNALRIKAVLRQFIAISALVVSGVAFSGSAVAGVDSDVDQNGVILAGYDAVAYFTMDKAVEGNANITAVHNDAIYRFSNEKHRDLFVKNPEKYAPAYGGFCAYGATFGKKFAVDGKAFKVVDGQLYVNKNLQVAKAWKEDIPKHIMEADGYWPKIENVSKDEL